MAVFEVESWLVAEGKQEKHDEAIPITQTSSTTTACAWNSGKIWNGIYG